MVDEYLKFSKPAELGQFNVVSYDYSWSDFGGYPAVIKNLQVWIDILNKPSFSNSLNLNNIKESSIPLESDYTNNATNLINGIDVPRGLLLYGPSGCGKSLLAKICSSLLNRKVIVLDLSHLYSEFWGQSEKFIRNLFENARNSIIIIDNIESVSINRSDTENGQLENTAESRVLSSLLNELDGVGNNYNLDTNEAPIVIATTNKFEQVDAALTRPGRFDRQVEISLPDQNDRLQILNLLISKVARSPNIDLEYISKMTDGYSGSQICKLFR
ncbi:Cell division cycle protein [Smittium mucronatum]|uniref:Cell division cycle protein n=1 Tax=Smittium mucronatum TaxID=133383 RepID=A0A1R0H4L9_9FUNG|nr:Cell division cycle protein [Smittium mucronatum]